MPRADYKVEVGWDAGAGVAFTFGESTLGGGDVLPGQFFSDFTGQYDDLSMIAGRNTVLSIRTNRGRDGVLDQIVSGDATVTVRDTTGLFNPRNASSPLTGQVLPMRPVKITATYLGVTYPLFRGFTDEIRHDPNDSRTTLSCLDAFVWLGRVNPVLPATGATTVGAVLNDMLDEVGWPASDRAIDAGGDIPSVTLDGSKSFLTVAGDILTADRGVIYIDAAGVFTYEDRYAWDNRAQVASLTSSMVAAEPSVALSGVFNRARVTREGGVEQEAVNPNSVGQFGFADVPTITSAYLVDDNQASALAEHLAVLNADPRAPVRGVRVANKTDALLRFQLEREIGDNIAVTEVDGGTSGNFTIQRITHDVTEGGFWHYTDYDVSFITDLGTPFVFGSSTLGGGDDLVY